MMNILDAHSHYMPLEVAQNTMFFKVNWSDIDQHLRTMDAHGIEKSLLLYPTSDAHINMGGWTDVCRIYNEKIAAVVKQHPDRFIGGGILPPDDVRSLQAELIRFEDLNLQVISLASSYEGVFLDDEKFYPIYQYAAKKNLPIHVHPQIMNPIGEDRVKDPLLTPVLEYVFDVSICIGKLMMTEVLIKFNDVNFIFAHYGGVLPIVKERFDNTYQMLRKRNFVKDIHKLPSEYFKNLYFDMSGSRSAASLLCALEVTDAGHLLFGSDFPANQHTESSIAVIKNAPLSAEQKKNIMSNNLQQLLSGVISV